LHAKILQYDRRLYENIQVEEVFYFGKVEAIGGDRFVTPTNALIDLILSWFQSGLSKLNDSRDLVSKLKSKAGQKRKLLADKQAEADGALKAITESMTVLIK